MRRIDWKLRSADLLTVIGILTIVAVLIVVGLACAAGNKAKIEATAKVEAPVTVEADLDVNARLNAAMVQIEELRAALIGPVSVGPIGGIRSEFQAGGDLQTVDSLTSQILARAVASTVKWSVLISVITVALYVLCHRFRSTRKVLDFCKGTSDPPRAPHVRALEYFFRGGCQCRYVDADRGDDANDGLTPQTAWKTFPEHFAGEANADGTDDRGLAGP